jgi:hypothetical protein
VKKHLTIILILCITNTFGFAQTVNGFWKGTLTMTSGCFPVNNIELQINLTGNEMRGASYHYLDINYYVKKNFGGTYYPDTKKLFVREGAVTTFKIPDHCKVCIKNYDLTYSRNGEVETLTGIWNGKIMGTGSDCDVGTIVLTRIKESAFKEIPEIEVDTGDIKLDFYDNGVVDGDSITVLVNKVPVLVNEKLSSKPVSSIIRVDLNNTFQEIEMVAENLGTIPPNTAILLITAGKKRYRLFLTSTEQKSAKVRFVYSPQDIDKQAFVQ